MGIFHSCEVLPYMHKYIQSLYIYANVNQIYVFDVLPPQVNYAADYFQTIFHSFEAGIANPISSSKYKYEQIHIFKM